MSHFTWNISHFLIGLLFLSFQVNAQLATNLAGNTSTGFVNSTGAGASFNSPSGVAVDSLGNVFVADVYNNAIRKITPEGVVSTFAGNSSGTYGFADGTGTGASFYEPIGITIDRMGNLYIADANNFAIRKITPQGVVSTFAGNGSYGFVNGTGTGASFGFPYGVAIDAAGNVFVADYGNNAIRKITAEGVVSTFAGGPQGFVNGTGTGASFYYPIDLAVDVSGNVFVSDYGNNAIRKITPEGVVSTFAGGSQGFVNGTGTGASFYKPWGIGLDASGNLYVSDSYNFAIRKITPAAVVSTYSTGSYEYVNGVLTGFYFYQPAGVAVDKAGNVYVADSDNNSVRKITPANSNTISGIKTLNTPTSTLVWPNPASDKINISQLESNQFNLVLLDQLGNQLLNKEIVGSEYVISTVGYTGGLYFVKLTLGNRVETFKIVIQ